VNISLKTRRVILLPVTGFFVLAAVCAPASTGLLATRSSAAQAAAPQVTAGQVAPRASGANSTLSFRVTARFAARDGGLNTAQPQQMLGARVFLKGNRARIETRMSDRPIVFLLAAPYAYKLLPQAKAGVRWRIDPKEVRSFSGTSLQGLLRSPASLRGMMQNAGGRKVTSTTLNGTPVDVWTARNFAGQSGTTKVWLRRSDGLPLRLEAASRTLATTVAWSDYRRNVPLTDALFRSPLGYSLRDSVGQPKLF
jgi:hypothetical protein